MWQRVIAGIIDFIIPYMSIFTVAEGGYIWVVGFVYFMLRDAAGCPGIGKFIFNIGVVNNRTGEQCDWKDSIKRNVIITLIITVTLAVFVITKAGLFVGIGLLAYIYRATQDAAGRNLIDRVSGTSVIKN